ncbi:Flp family type IVb pilin [Marinimicrococcus flavescens]|uniref:Flp family type IVb pilin n=1 Tax=Marinimicrococcus flavescens TaxID=3031815 RepID=A0AAP4D560_9PROT|nr:Flp family type IVb pilin [Marinimicrococcus flavescens]
MTMFRKLWQDESGATAIEYGLIAALISVAIIATLQALQGSLEDTFNDIKAALDAAGG